MMSINIAWHKRLAVCRKRRSAKGKQRMSLMLREKKRCFKKQRAVSKKKRAKARKDLRALRKKLKEEMEAEISRYLNDLNDKMT